MLIFFLNINSFCIKTIFTECNQNIEIESICTPNIFQMFNVIVFLSGMCDVSPCFLSLVNAG